MKPNQLIVALDIPQPRTDKFTGKPLTYISWSKGLMHRLLSTGCMFKIGMQLHAAASLEEISLKQIVQGIPPRRLMLDLKLGDTPDTVAKTTLMLCKALKPKFFTIPLPYNHPSVVAAAKLLKEKELNTTILGITVLTSMNATAVWEASDSLYEGEGAAAKAVTHFATLGKMAGLQGLVCSPHEVHLLKSFKFKYLVTPGIRLPGAESHDQKRIATPAGALAAGATHLVVGRPITEAADPVAAAQAILASAPT